MCYIHEAQAQSHNVWLHPLSLNVHKLEAHLGAAEEAYMIIQT
jgi:hypothetical protein